MSFPGSVINGRIVLDPPGELPDGTHVEVVVREPERLREEKLVRRFHHLVREWKDAKVFTSSGTDIALQPAYQQIIGMGKEAIPLILEELQREEDHWFWAPKAITGDDPVAPSDRGQLPKMTEAWLKWQRTVICHVVKPCFSPLGEEGYTETSPSTRQYNCIAWAAGTTDACDLLSAGDFRCPSGRSRLHS